MFFLTGFFAGRPLPAVAVAGVAICYFITSGATPEVLARTLAGASIGTSTLTAHREGFAMTEAAVAAEIHQALDALLHFAARVAFDLDRSVDGVADGLDVGFGQLVDLAALGDVCLLANGPSGGRTDAVDVRKGVSNCLAA